MPVILLDKVANLGSLGDQVNAVSYTHLKDAVWTMCVFTPPGTC